MRTVERTNSRRFPGQMLACFLALWVGAATAAQGGDAKSSPMWLVTVRPATPHLHDMAKWTAEQKNLAQAHGQYLQTLYDQGIIVYGGRAFDVTESGRLTDESFALVVVHANDRATATQLFAKDPAVRGGLLTARVISFEQAFPGASP